MKRYVTAESVCIGHPDKVCDRISDTILDECLAKDRGSHAAVEALATRGKIVVAGEIACKERVNARDCVRRALLESGYDPDYFTVSVFLHSQSRDIAGGVQNPLEERVHTKGSKELGAGDQGTMYGYATSESEEMLPLPLLYAHEVCMKLDQCRVEGEIKGIHSDGKAQVSMIYEDGRPLSVDTVIVSIQHDEDKDLAVLEQEIHEKVLVPVFGKFPKEWKTNVYINPSGRFVEGGPDADTGLTGRKIIVDTYGGIAPHGGGAFSGKDATKVDRSGAYMARWISKHIVTAGLAERCTVSISYAIGKAEPVAVDIDTHGTGTVFEGKIMNAVLETFPLTPAGIIRALDLRKPIFRQTSAYGHFTNQFLPWERIDRKKVEKLKELTR